MNKFFTAVSSAYAKVKFQTVKHSPEILLIGGIGLSVASVILAVSATLKSKDVIEDYKLDKLSIESTDKIQDPTENTGLVPYTDEMKASDLTKVKIRTGLLLLKNYSPVILAEVLSITALVASNKIMRRRTLALAAAYTALDTSFKDYRNRVIDRFGKDIDEELRYGVKKQTIPETTVDENGKERTVEKEVTTVDPNIDAYMRIFDETNPYWEKNAEYNRHFLLSNQSYLNDLLTLHGYVFLNDVYDRLGYPKTKVGQVMGWIKNKDNPDAVIDLGMFNPGDKNSTSFVNGYERSIWIRPNVQGYILDKIENEEGTC